MAQQPTGYYHSRGWLALGFVLSVNIGLALWMYGPWVTSDTSEARAEHMSLLYALHTASMLSPLDEGTLPWTDLKTLITSGYLHGDLGHLTFNMVPLAVLGWFSIRRLGAMGFLVLYHFAMVLAAVGYLGFASPWSSMWGASGAVHGLGGAWVVWAWTDRPERRFRVLLPILWLGFIITVNSYLYITMDGGFAWQLHVAGVLVGVALAILWPPLRTAPAPVRYIPGQA